MRVTPELAARLGAVSACAIGLITATAMLVAGITPSLHLAGFGVQLDGVSAWIVLPVLLGGIASVLAGGRAASTGAAVLVLLMADAALLGLALAVLVVTARVRSTALIVWAGLTAAAVLLLALHAGPAFAAMRAEPPDGLLAAAVLALSLGGLAASWRAALRGDLGDPACIVTVGLYLAVRITLDLCGNATPVWWGVLVGLLGLGGAVLGGVRAAAAGGLASLLAGGAVAGGGLGCAGLGVALAARGADLPPLAALGLEAALLHAFSLSASLGLLAARPAGIGALVGAANLAVLPPSLGFAALYLLLQALFAANRIGGVALQFGCAGAVAAVGLTAALGTVGALRAAGLGWLARSAPAQGGDAIGSAVLAGIVVLLGIAPGLLVLLAGPALQALTAAAPADVSLLAPLAIAALLAMAGAAAVAFRRAGPAARRVLPWQGGAAGAARLGGYVPAVLAAARPGLPAARWPSLREWLMVAAGVLLVLLIVLAAR